MVVLMARVAREAGVFAVVLRIRMARAAGYSRMPSRRDVEPRGAVGIGPCVLHVAFLAVPARPIGRMRESGAPEVRLVTARAFGRSRYDLERLQVAMAVAAFEGAMRTHQREARHVVIESRDVPRRRAMAFVAIPSEGALVIIRVAARAVLVGVQKLFADVTFDARHVLMEREETFRWVLELDEREGHAGRMAALAFLPEIRIVRGFVAARALRLGLPLSVARLARHVRVMSHERKTGLCMLFGEGGRGRIGPLHLIGSRHLDGLPLAGFHKEGKAQERRHDEEEKEYPMVLARLHT